MPKALVLAGTRSGCGKTSVALGLMRALARRGLTVQPFKAGPDFIDPGLHTAAAGRASHNLDTWMLPEAFLRAGFARHAAGADVVIVEGVMGLFDGRGGGPFDGQASADEEGSTAHLAKLLGLSVVLVMDASSQARSAAAVALGFARFDPDLRLAGVVHNRVASPRHEAILRQAMASLPEVPLLGCLPRAGDLGLASRHLGLVIAEDVAELDARLEALADWVEQGLDVPALLSSLPDLDLPLPTAETSAAPSLPRVRIGLAQDRAFCFVYAENLRLLEAAGAEVVPFSPLTDAALPEDLDGLYLPGGYPELVAAELSANKPMLEAVRAFCAPGRTARPVWAECGGFMYLQRALVDADGVEHALCGVFPARAIMRGQRAALGYREARTLVPGPLGPEGTLLRGHEFHYSELEQGGPTSAGGAQAAFALTASDGAQALDGAASGNVVGGYFHAHLASNPDVARAFVAACLAGRKGS